MTWSEYVAAYVGDRAQSKLARLVGVESSTITRWLDGGSVSAENAIRFARAVGDSPLIALVEAGKLTAEEVGVELTVTNPSDEEVEELVVNLRRIVSSPRLVVRGGRVDRDSETDAADV